MHHGQVAGRVEAFVQSEKGAMLVEDNTDLFLAAMTHELKNQIEQAEFIQKIHSESAKIRAVSDSMHALLPLVMKKLIAFTSDEHRMDVIIANVFQASE